MINPEKILREYEIDEKVFSGIDQQTGDVDTVWGDQTAHPRRCPVLFHAPG